MGEVSGLIAALIWATTNIMMRSQSDRFDILTLNAIRVLGAVPIALLLPVLIGSGPGVLQSPPLALVYIVAGGMSAMGIGDTIYYTSQKILGVSRAQPISNIYPIFTLALAALFLGEQATWALGVAIVLVVAGIYLLTEKRDNLSSSAAAGKDARLGVALAVAAGFWWAVGTVLFRQGMLDLSVFTANQLRIPAVGIALLGVVRLTGRPMQFGSYGWRTLLIVGGAGVLGIGLGSLLFLYSVQTTSAAKAALLSSMSPFFGAPLAALFLGEQLTWRAVFGMLLCVVGVWLIFFPSVLGLS